GGFIAWVSQAWGGFEADKQLLFIYGRKYGWIKDLTKNFDGSVGSFAWNKYEEGHVLLYFTAEDHGKSPIYELRDDGVPREKTRSPTDDLEVVIDDRSERLYFTRMSIGAARESGKLEVGCGSEREQISHMN